ncbi:MAG: helix-turn-helix domain-containing protein [Thermomicrobiales bacterium]
MQIDGKTVYTLTEAAARLGIAPTTLKRQRQNGRITGILVGRDYVYSDEAIRHYQTEIQMHAGKRSHAAQRVPGQPI